MAIHIKDTETERLARELAARSGESITQSTKRAITERLARIRGGGGRNSDKNRNVQRAEICRIVQRIAALPELDPRSAEEIIGFDESGLPRGW